LRKVIRILYILYLLVAFLPSRAQLSREYTAGFEYSEGLLLTWAYDESIDSTLAAISKYMQESSRVWIIYRPSGAPVDTTGIRNYLLGQGVGYLNVHFVPGEAENNRIRDYGPVTGYGDFGNGQLQRFFLDPGYSQYGSPMADSIPSQLAGSWGWQTAEFPLEIEGGNILLDGFKRGFCSKRVMEQNPGMTQTEIWWMLMETFGLEDWVFIDPIEHSGGWLWEYIDGFMKFTDYETLLVSKYPDTLPDYPVLEQTVQQILALTSIFEKSYKVIRIPAPPRADGTFATTQDEEMRSYTNSVILNGTVLVPSYNLPDYDSAAMNIYRQVMPGYDIRMIDARILSQAGSSLHTITREVPVEKYFRIRHGKVTGSQPFVEDFLIYTYVYCAGELDSLFLYYRIHPESDFTKIPFSPVCPQYMALIDKLNPSDTVSYYIEAWSGDDVTRLPFVAPKAAYTFWFDGVTGAEACHNRPESSFSIFPNPTTDIINITASVSGEYVVTIYNMTGEEMIRRTFTGDKCLITLDELTSGLYLVKITGKDGSRAEKISVIKR
jgi:agmatine/peptidylarginine deiminase